jgi:hypothetical protein
MEDILYRFHDKEKEQFDTFEKEIDTSECQKLIKKFNKEILNFKKNEVKGPFKPVISFPKDKYSENAIKCFKDATTQFDYRLIKDEKIKLFWKSWRQITFEEIWF